MGFAYRIRSWNVGAQSNPSVTAEVRRLCGLGHLDEQSTQDWYAVTDDEGGVVFGPCEVGIPSDWLRFNDRCDIGWLDLPVPGQLRRSSFIGGSPVRDAGGRTWVVPVVNPKSARCSLPTEYEWTSDGPVLVPAASQNCNVELCEMVLQEIVEAGRLKREMLATRALEVLGINYLVRLPEMMALAYAGANALTVDVCSQIIAVFLDHSQILTEV